MASQLVTAVKLLGPRIPLIIKTVILNLLSWSPNSSKQTLVTEVAVTVLRSILSVKKPLSQVQRFGLRDPGIKGPKWIAKASIPIPDADESQELLDLLTGQIRELGTGDETYTLPTVDQVTGEWTGYRKGAASHTNRPDLPSEADHYKALEAETTSPLTILYFHGGAYFMMDPASHRDTTAHLAKLTGGKAFSVRYRLAPQNAFPAQLLDALISYLYLIAPPKDSFHSPISPSNIVFAGDSAGGNLALVLTQLILSLERTNRNTITFHGQSITLLPPAGISSSSPWCDIPRSLPSVTQNAQYDYLDPPSRTGLPRVEQIVDEIWPTSPPRAELFCNASMIHHPLVSPVICRPEHWKNAPPVFFAVGTEGLEDEICLTAKRIHQAGVPVQLVNYEGMPHCFAMIFKTSPAAKDCFNRWAKFCLDAVNHNITDTKTALVMKLFSNPLEFREVSWDEACRVSDEQAEKCFKEAEEEATKREAVEVKAWREQQTKAKL